MEQVKSMGIGFSRASRLIAGAGLAATMLITPAAYAQGSTTGTCGTTTRTVEPGTGRFNFLVITVNLQACRANLHNITIRVRVPASAFPASTAGVLTATPQDPSSLLPNMSKQLLGNAMGVTFGLQTPQGTPIGNVPMQVSFPLSAFPGGGALQTGTSRGPGLAAPLLFSTDIASSAALPAVYQVSVDGNGQPVLLQIPASQISVQDGQVVVPVQLGQQGDLNLVISPELLPGVPAALAPAATQAAPAAVQPAPAAQAVAPAQDAVAPAAQPAVAAAPAAVAAAQSTQPTGNRVPLLPWLPLGAFGVALGGAATLVRRSKGRDA
jgi:hypothetical protein